MASATAKNRVKTTTWSICPFDAAANGLAGMNDRTKSLTLATELSTCFGSTAANPDLTAAAAPADSGNSFSSSGINIAPAIAESR